MKTGKKALIDRNPELVIDIGPPVLEKRICTKETNTRVGFFSTNAFFENWGTNVDNQFRVAVNQSLLAGLHIGFNASEQTQPFGGARIDGEHAVEDCYGCHKNIDPMRAYFSRSFNVRYQRPFGDSENAQILANARIG